MFYRLTGDEEEEDAWDPLRVSHMTWISSNQLLLSTLDVTGSNSMLLLAELRANEKEARVTRRVELEGHVMGVTVGEEVVGGEQRAVVLQLTDGSLLRYVRGETCVCACVCVSQRVGECV